MIISKVNLLINRSLIIILFYFSLFQYDPKSRPTFHDASKKLTLLLEKYEQESTSATSPLSSLELINCSPNGSDTEATINFGTATPTVGTVCTAPAGLMTPQHRREVDEEGFRFPSTGISCKSASAALPGTPNWLVDGAGYDEHILKSRVRRVTQKLEAEILLHRRSLSENIIHFPLHTSPSDKARCHQMQRQRSSTHSPTPPRQLANGSQTAAVLLPITNVPEPPPLPPPVSAVLTLRKVGETMCLKDPQYKPSSNKDHNGTKPNPFTALAQLRGVKKILGANPRTYAAGVGDLFSSCFEMSAPFFKELVAMQGKTLTTGGENEGNAGGATTTTNACGEPKSLPVSPQLTRKYSAMELKLPQRSNSNAVPAAASATTTPATTTETTNTSPAVAVAADIDDCDDCNSEGEDLDGGGNCADAESSSDDSAVRPSTIPAARKYRANSLYTHPLFRGSSGTFMKYSSSEHEVPSLLKSSNSTNTLTSVTMSADMNTISNDKDESKELPNAVGSSSTSAMDHLVANAPPVAIQCSTQTKEDATSNISVASCPDLELNELKNSCDLLPLKRNVTRRDSIESGFYSCFNEESDAAITNTSYSRQLCGIGSLVNGSNCCYEQLKSQLLLETAGSNKLK